MFHFLSERIDFRVENQPAQKGCDHDC